jgi:hypothetical protein
MKTIELSDEDYDLLMSLAAELQTQPNDGNAHPVCWSPSSLKRNVVAEGCGEIHFIDDDGGEFTLEELFKSEGNSGDKTIGEEFIQYYTNDDPDANITIDTMDMYWDEFENYLDDEYRFRKVELREERVCEQNFSLFKSDVKNFCETNQHHLGKDPRTYSQSIWRMPKMRKLVELVAKLNIQPLESIEGDIRYILHPRKD